MLKASGVCKSAGVGERAFLKKAENRGIAVKRRGKRIGGRQLSWYRLDISDVG